MCGIGHQACLDALHDGHQARFGGEHDQRLARSGGDVQGEWDCGHSGNVSESIFEPDPFHGMMRMMWRTFGFLSVN